jgi:hypothetical protein
MASSKAPSLAQKRRRHLLKQPAAKGDPRKENLWAVRGFDGSRVVFASDLALHHFLFTEGDPSVRTVRYHFGQAHAPGVSEEVCFDALVTFSDGRQVCRHVRKIPSDLVPGCAAPGVLPPRYSVYGT